MKKFQSILSWICAGLCVVAGNAVAEEIDAEQVSEVHKQYFNRFQSYLETSEYPYVRTLRATQLLGTNEPASMERGVGLIKEVLVDPDPASLWAMAMDCQFHKTTPWCESDGAYKLLKQADPDNAAVLMLGFSLDTDRDDEGILDTKLNRQLLGEMSQAKHFDGYWGRGADKLYAEALRFVEANPVPAAPSGTHFDKTPHAYALHLAMGHVVTVPVLGYQWIISFCRLQGEAQRLEGVEACKRLARTMVETGRTFLNRNLGYALERETLKAIDPDDKEIPKLQRRKEALNVAYFCLTSSWLGQEDRFPEVDQATLMDYVRNLNELGEWQSIRLNAIQEYKVTPEYYVVAPSECEKVRGLGDDELEALIKGRPALEVWQQWQDEAKTKSE